jgi:hypothetical protein
MTFSSLSAVSAAVAATLSRTTSCAHTLPQASNNTNVSSFFIFLRLFSL